MAAPKIPNWQQLFLQKVGAPVTPANLKFVNAWARAEGGSASNNPFNTTQTAPGATSYNSVGVRNYVSPQQGLDATAQTLLNGRYGNILSALRSGTDPVASAQALANSPWGTGSLVLKVLGAGASALSPGAAPGAPPPQVPIQRPQAPSLDLFNVGNQMFGLPQLTAPLPAPMVRSGAAPGPARIKASAKGAKAVNIAAKQLGIPYVWGGESTKGFDCSGLLQYAWARVGVQIPRTTYDQFRTGKPVNANQLQPGDAVFFKGSDSIKRNGEVLPGHVGIFIGGGKFIEAPRTGLSVRISSLKGRSDFMGARRF